jgi:hypothetical protein
MTWEVNELTKLEPRVTIRDGLEVPASLANDFISDPSSPLPEPERVGHMRRRGAWVCDGGARRVAQPPTPSRRRRIAVAKTPTRSEFNSPDPAIGRDRSDSSIFVTKTAIATHHRRLLHDPGLNAPDDTPFTRHPPRNSEDIRGPSPLDRSSSTVSAQTGGAVCPTFPRHR